MINKLLRNNPPYNHYIINRWPILKICVQSLSCCHVTSPCYVVLPSGPIWQKQHIQKRSGTKLIQVLLHYYSLMLCYGIGLTSLCASGRTKNHSTVNVSKILITPLKLFRVSSQVGINKTNRRVVEVKPNSCATFIALQCVHMYTF